MNPITPYLIFDGNCADAMTFYQDLFGGKLDTMKFGDAPGNPPPEARDRLVHARLHDGAMVLMASDNMPGMPYAQGNSNWLTFDCDSDAKVDALFARLAEGGTVGMQPQDTFWKAYFAMVTDRFGVNWMLNHGKPDQA